MRRLRALAVAGSLALPVLLLAGMAGRAELALRDGVVIRVAISGYDPRDPLRGHFLRYKIDWNWQDGEPDQGVEALCVMSRTGENPPVRPSSSRGGASCPLWLRLEPNSRTLTPVGTSNELFVPEDSAERLSQSLASGDAAVTIDLVVSRDGTARIRDWHIDGRTLAEWKAVPVD